MGIPVVAFFTACTGYASQQCKQEQEIFYISRHSFEKFYLTIILIVPCRRRRRASSPTGILNQLFIVIYIIGWQGEQIMLFGEHAILKRDDLCKIRKVEIDIKTIHRPIIRRL